MEYKDRTYAKRILTAWGTCQLDAKQKHLGYKKVRGQEKPATKSFDIK